METIFKICDKVFDIAYGWGKIVKIMTTSDYTKEPILVFKNEKEIYNFYDLKGRNLVLIDNIIVYRSEVPVLSHNEYSININ